MSDPREDMRRILHGRPEKKPAEDPQENYERTDTALDIVEYIGIDRKGDPAPISYFDGLMKMADDALDAAKRCLDD